MGLLREEIISEEVQCPFCNESGLGCINQMLQSTKAIRKIVPCGFFGLWVFFTWLVGLRFLFVVVLGWLGFVCFVPLSYQKISKATTELLWFISFLMWGEFLNVLSVLETQMSVLAYSLLILQSTLLGYILERWSPA